MTIENVLESNIENVSRVEEGYCPYEPNDPNWSLDPCCNERAEVCFSLSTFLFFFPFSHLFSLKAVFCCAPQKISEEEDLYTEADIVDIDLICANPDCDESFFTDIAASLNAIGNPLTGCASGLGVGIFIFIVILIIMVLDPLFFLLTYYVNLRNQSTNWMSLSKKRWLNSFVLVLYVLVMEVYFTFFFFFIV